MFLHFPKTPLYAPSLPGNSVFHLHHFRDSSVSYVLAFPEDSVLYSHHFGDFSVSSAASFPPQNSVFHVHHFRDCSVSSVPSIPEHSVISKILLFIFRHFGVFCRPTVSTGRDEFDPGVFSAETETQQFVLFRIISKCPKFPVFFCFLISGISVINISSFPVHFRITSRPPVLAVRVQFDPGLFLFRE